MATAPTSASHPLHPLNIEEGTLGSDLRDSESVVKFIVVDTAFGTGPSFTIGPRLDTAKKSDNSAKYAILLEKHSSVHYRNSVSSFEASNPFFWLPLQQAPQIWFTSRFTHRPFW
jgi:hypothetical protein